MGTTWAEIYPRGGADTWDAGPAGALLSGEAFGDPPRLYYVIGPASGWVPASAAQIVAGLLGAGGAATAAGNMLAPSSSTTVDFPAATGLTAGAQFRAAVVWWNGIQASNIVEVQWAQEAAGGDAAAPGATLTATASLIAGNATGQVNATGAGVTLTATASLLAGAASGQVNASAPGATLTAASSLLAGAASGQGNATAAGATLTASAALVAGAAAGQVNAAAAGVTLAAASSLVAGSASGEGAGVAAGVVVAAAASLLAGSASGQQAAEAAGVTLVASSSLLRGSATGAAPGVCDPADVWAYMLPTGLSAADTVSQIHAMLTALTGGAVELPVDVKKMNGAPVIGTGQPADLWRGA